MTGARTCAGGEACSPTPVPVSGINDATAISGTCALLATGRVECWGDNSDAQLGDGSTRGPMTCLGLIPCSTTPVMVAGIRAATSIATGDQGACAVLAGGTVDCWGDGSYGELGDGNSGTHVCPEGDLPNERTNRCSPTPQRVTGITNAVQVAVGDDSTCARLATGAVDCWGDNGAGQLGDGTVDGASNCGRYDAGDPCSATPMHVTGITNATSIAVGFGACAALATGRVDCWGPLLNRGDGQRIEGVYASDVPIPVAGIT